MRTLLIGIFCCGGGMMMSRGAVTGDQDLLVLSILSLCIGFGMILVNTRRGRDRIIRREGQAIWRALLLRHIMRR